MSKLSTRILDHIVHITPPGTLQESVDAFRKLGFTVSPGGTHTDAHSANNLVLLADGIYLELLHYTETPPPDSTEPWVRKQPGWVDFAFLGNNGTPSIAATINARADREGTDVRYTPEREGGRILDSGREIQWLISEPDGDEELRGIWPFFCGDITPRKYRVPLEPHANIEHPNTAIGVAHVKLLVTPEELDLTAKELTSVTGAPPRSSTKTEVTWDLDLQPSRTRPPVRIPKLILQTAQTEEEEEYVRVHGLGIYEIGILVTDPGQRRGETTPYGKIVWVPARS